METVEQTEPNGPEIQRWQYGAVLVLGMIFGVVLYKSEVIRWERINKMFLFEEAHMYIIIGVAVAVGICSMWIIKRFEVRTVTGETIAIVNPPFQVGIVYGGFSFGVGWAITAACPGPIYAQIGAGEPAALVTFGGALVGMFLYSSVRPHLPH